MNHKPCCALILAILAGCGGSDNNDPVAVSPSPNAPAESPVPVPGTPPAVPEPAPTPTPAPPDAPGSPDAPPPAEVKALVDGSAVIAALSRPRYTEPVFGDALAGWGGGYPTTSTLVEQRVEPDPAGQDGQGTYAFSSSGYMNRGAFIESRYNLPRARVAGTWAIAGSGQTASFALGPDLEGDTVQASTALSSPTGVVVVAGQRYELDQRLGTWTASAGIPADTTAWEASLKLSSDYVDDLFRVCWKLRFPARDRTSCGVFDRAGGDLRGVHLVDDSLGFGRLIWRSANLPAAPAGLLPAIGGDVLIKALSRPRYSDPVTGDVAAGYLTEGDVSTTTFVEQRVDRDDPQTPVGVYDFASGGYMNRGPEIPARYNLRNARLTGRWQMSGSGSEEAFTLFDHLDADNGQQIRGLSSRDHFVVSAASTYELDRTLAQWTNTGAPYDWDAALAIHSDDARPDWFRLCWQMTYYPEVFRQSCGLFERQSGDFMGVHVVDDSDPPAPLVWRSDTAQQPTPEPENPPSAASASAAGS